MYTHACPWRWTAIGVASREEGEGEQGGLHMILGCKNQITLIEQSVILITWVK